MKHSATLLTTTIITLSGCATAPPEMYDAESLPTTASVVFENARPFIYRGGQPTEQIVAVIHFVPGAYSNLSVSIYDDAERCTTRKVVPVDGQENGPVKVEAGKLHTFNVTTFEATDEKLVRCSSRFSFTPEADKQYSVRNSVFSETAEHARCRIQVFEDGSETAMEIIPRINDMPLWTQSSPRCDKSELVEPAFSKDAFADFECFIKIGSYPCQRPPDYLDYTRPL